MSELGFGALVSALLFCGVIWARDIIEDGRDLEVAACVTQLPDVAASYEYCIGRHQPQLWQEILARRDALGAAK